MISKCNIKLDVIQSISCHLPPLWLAKLTKRTSWSSLFIAQDDRYAPNPADTLLILLASFLWSNFQLLLYISILPLSSEKFPSTSTLLTSMFNNSFIHWLKMKLGCSSPLIWRLSFVPHPSVRISGFRGSPKSASLGLYHFCLSQRRHLQASRSPVSIPWNLTPGQPSSSTANPTVTLDNFSMHVGLSQTPPSFPTLRGPTWDLAITQNITSEILKPRISFSDKASLTQLCPTY